MAASSGFHSLMSRLFMATFPGKCMTVRVLWTVLRGAVVVCRCRLKNLTLSVSGFAECTCPHALECGAAMNRMCQVVPLGEVFDGFGDFGRQGAELVFDADFKAVQVLVVVGAEPMVHQQRPQMVGRPSCRIAVT
jgi:hypothetical protein